MLLLLKILVLIICSAYTIIILMYCWGWIQTKTNLIKEDKIFETQVSIIVVARNEEQNILQLINCLTAQVYPKQLFEIIIVDDASTDNTRQIIEEAMTSCKNLKSIFLEDDKEIRAHKKRAISIAIESAIGNLIVTTDADCVMGKNWLASIVNYYESTGAKMIIGPVAFHQESSFFEKMQSLEFAGLIVASGASAYFNTPIMCNGANLTYEKSLFIEIGGFKGVDMIASGDDVLLMQKVGSFAPKSIHFLKSEVAIVYTKASKTWTHFFNQRIRWASKAIKMKELNTSIISGVVFSFNALMPLILLLSVFQHTFVHLLYILFVIKCIVDFLFLFLAVTFFKKKRFILLLLPEQIVYPVYVLAIGIWGIRGKYKWKDRLLK